MEQKSSNTQSPVKRVVQYITFMLLILGIFVLLQELMPDKQNYDFFKVLELRAVTLILALSIVALIQYKVSSNDQFLVLGSGFAVMFIIELTFILTMSVSKKQPLSINSDVMFAWHEILEGIMLPLIAIYAWWIWSKEHRFNKTGLFSKKNIVLSILAIGIILFLVIEMLPLSRIMAPQSAVGEPVFLFTALPYFIAVFLLLIKNEWRSDNLDHLWIIGLISGFFSYIFFAANSINQGDALSIGHQITKLLSYILILIGIIWHMYQHFMYSESERARLKSENIRLKDAEETYRVLKIMAEKNRRKIEKALAETQKSKKELEQVNEIMVDRELKMVELKKELQSLKNRPSIKQK